MLIQMGVGRILLLTTLTVVTSFVVSNRKPIAVYTGLIIADIVEDEQGIYPEQWSNLNILLSIWQHTLVGSTRTWPFATQHLKIFRDSDLIIYSSGSPDPEVLEPLLFWSVTVKLFPLLEIPSSFFFFASQQDIELQKQTGVKRAITICWTFRTHATPRHSGRDYQRRHDGTLDQPLDCPLLN